MIKVGDLVEHAVNNGGIGIVIDIKHNRYRVKWIRSPFSNHSTDTWSGHLQLKLMETK